MSFQLEQVPEPHKSRLKKLLGNYFQEKWAFDAESGASFYLTANDVLDPTIPASYILEWNGFCFGIELLSYHYFCAELPLEMQGHAYTYVYVINKTIHSEAIAVEMLHEIIADAVRVMKRSPPGTRVWFAEQWPALPAPPVRRNEKPRVRPTQLALAVWILACVGAGLAYILAPTTFQRIILLLLVSTPIMVNYIRR